MEMVSFNSFLKISDIFTPTALWLVLLLVIGGFAIISAVLLYHWNKYALRKEVAKKVISVYFVVSGIFILLLLGSLMAVVF